jgi:hypothetical protein
MHYFKYLVNDNIIPSLANKYCIHLRDNNPYLYIVCFVSKISSLTFRTLPLQKRLPMYKQLSYNRVGIQSLSGISS